MVTTNMATSTSTQMDEENAQTNNNNTPAPTTTTTTTTITPRVIKNRQKRINNEASGQTQCAIANTNGQAPFVNQIHPMPTFPQPQYPQFIPMP